MSHEKTITRKIKEWVWTIQIERKYSKEEILETFLNEIYFGHSAYGVEAAAQTYFGKSISEVTLPEAAFLAGVINGPGYFSPHYDMEAAVRRRNIVLNRMAELGYITQEEAEEAKATPLEVIELQPRRREASYFVEYILQTYLIPKFGDQQVYAGGLRVYTTLDLDLQRAAEQAVISLLPAGTPDAKGLHQPQAALVSLDPQTGHILAMVGGRGEDQFNRATSVVRQPGSAIKPFVFALALEQRDITPATVFVDEPVEIPLVTGEVYKPSNFGNVYRGPLTVREALERSVNVVAVQVLLSLDGTMKRAVEFMKELGISTLVESGRVNDMVPALALGGLTRGVTPLEMAAAYATFANNGIYVEPIGVLRVEAYDGTVLDEPRPERRVVLSEEASYLINDMLRGVIEAPHGTGRAAADLGRPAAGKTGTSQGDTNAWFVGYTPDLVTSVWIGNDQQSQPLDFGSRRAVEIWTEFMAQALADRPPRWFERPPGVVQMRIDTMTGLRVPDGCVYVPPGETRVELFIEGTEPMSVSPRSFRTRGEPVRDLVWAALKLDDGDAGASLGRIAQAKALYLPAFGQILLYRGPQCPGSLAVDDPGRLQIGEQCFVEILGQAIQRFFGSEASQVQLGADFHRFTLQRAAGKVHARAALPRSARLVVCGLYVGSRNVHRRPPICT